MSYQIVYSIAAKEEIVGGRGGGSEVSPETLMISEIQHSSL